jgi:hypothetical protein
MQNSWEDDLAQLLGDLSQVQDELLKLLTRKRELLLASDTAGLAAIAPEEARLSEALQACVDRRQRLLENTSQEGKAATSLRSLAGRLPRSQRQRFEEDLRATHARARLLKHHSLTNWVLIQRTLLHLSQLLEIIATGGRLQPTYGEGTSARAGGVLVDRAV